MSSSVTISILAGVRISIPWSDGGIRRWIDRGMVSTTAASFAVSISRAITLVSTTHVTARSRRVRTRRGREIHTNMTAIQLHGVALFFGSGGFFDRVEIDETKGFGTERHFVIDSFNALDPSLTTEDSLQRFVCRVSRHVKHTEDL